MVLALTPASIWAWPDPAVLLSLTCYMTGALAHLSFLRQPLATIWVSLSVWSCPNPRIAELVDFPLLPPSICTPLSRPAGSSLEDENPSITFLPAISGINISPGPPQWPDPEKPKENRKEREVWQERGGEWWERARIKTYTHKGLIKWSFKCANG